MSKTSSLHPRQLRKYIITIWRKGWLYKIATLLVLAVFISTTAMYTVAQWYIFTNRNQQLRMGVSFIPAYAQSLGIDPEETMDALLDIGVRDFRLVSYWNQHETEPGNYDFSQLDWQFAKAEAADANVTLTLGLRQPRWPECHMPDWASKLPTADWHGRLKTYIEKVVERYKNSPALQDYQLENEYLLKGFGICNDFSRERLVKEYNLVKQLDPKRDVIVGRSNNALGFPIGDPRPDEFSISVYKRVWDAGVTKRYLEYPYPSWFYGYLAGVQKLYSGRDMRIAELQAEAWAPNGLSLTDIDLAEQNKSLNADRLQDRFEYGRGTGMKRVDLWGAEYWYYRKQVLGDPSLWEIAKTEFRESSN